MPPVSHRPARLPRIPSEVVADDPPDDPQKRIYDHAADEFPDADEFLATFGWIVVIVFLALMLMLAMVVILG
jgi:hypothetical protein